MGCFLIGVTGKGFSASGQALIGSVSDDPYDIRTFMKAVRPKKKSPFLRPQAVKSHPKAKTLVTRIRDQIYRESGQIFEEFFSQNIRTIAHGRL